MIFGFLAQKDLAFKPIDFGFTWSRLIQKSVVRTKLDMYDFIDN
jgi:hypothetical protein